MSAFKPFRISVPKRRRILLILSLFFGLYWLFFFLLKVTDFTAKAPIKYVASRLKHAKLSELTQFSKSTSYNNLAKYNLSLRPTAEPPLELSIEGALNAHTWVFACGLGLQRFRENPLVPIAPNMQTFVNNLELKWTEQNKGIKALGKRIFGYIFAPVTGRYSFSMWGISDAEFWLSQDHSWENIQPICNSSRLCATEIHLNMHHYYFIEILLLQNWQDSFQLKWKMPNSDVFEKISKQHLYSYMRKSLEFGDLIKDVPLTRVTGSFIYTNPKLSILSSTEKFLSGARYVEWNDVKLALPLCQYQPGYVGKTVLHQYHAVEQFVNPSYVYPEVKHEKLKEGKWDPWFPLTEKEALDIVRNYLKHLEDKYPGKYTLKQILNVERKPDWHKTNQVFYKGTLKHGDRYFLELLLSENMRNADVILSEYVYQHEKTKTLCYPEGMQWNKSASVYFLISVRKQAVWVQHFIKNVERIYQNTLDENLHVIVYDYNSSDINIQAEFQQSSFKNYKILNSPDSSYSRTYSLNRAAQAVQDPNAIIFTLDLHLEIPVLFPDSVRKHCIKGVMVYTPIITRLACGASAKYVSGAWDPWGYGMFGSYKTDWDKFQGFDEIKFKTKWGGEDWDLVNRAYVAGLEFDRIKQADFYHYDHSRVGMWT